MRFPVFTPNPRLIRWSRRSAFALFFFALLHFGIPPLYAIVTEAQLVAAMRSRGWDRGLVYGDGGSKVHQVCTSDADCSGGGNNPLVCKTLTITYANGSSAYTTRRCEATHCPSPFAVFAMNGNRSMTVDALADALAERGRATSVTISVPSPAVNPWDPRHATCKRQEAETARPCPGG